MKYLAQIKTASNHVKRLTDVINFNIKNNFKNGEPKNGRVMTQNIRCKLNIQSFVQDILILGRFGNNVTFDFMGDDIFKIRNGKVIGFIDKKLKLIKGTGGYNKIVAA